MTHSLVRLFKLHAFALPIVWTLRNLTAEKVAERTVWSILVEENYSVMFSVLKDVSQQTNHRLLAIVVCLELEQHAIGIQIANHRIAQTEFVANESYFSNKLKHKMTFEPCPAPQTEIGVNLLHVSSRRFTKTDFCVQRANERYFRMQSMSTEEKEAYESEEQRIYSNGTRAHQLLNQQRLHMFHVLGLLQNSKDQKLIEWKKSE